MGAAIGLREDFDGAALRRLARTTKSANQGRRLLALAEICDGGRPLATDGGGAAQLLRGNNALYGHPYVVICRPV